MVIPLLVLSLSILIHVSSDSDLQARRLIDRAHSFCLVFLHLGEYFIPVFLVYALCSIALALAAVPPAFAIPLALLRLRFLLVKSLLFIRLVFELFRSAFPSQVRFYLAIHLALSNAHRPFIQVTRVHVPIPALLRSNIIDSLQLSLVARIIVSQHFFRYLQVHLRLVLLALHPLILRLFHVFQNILHLVFVACVIRADLSGLQVLRSLS